jgi:SAM-dependent methyltransferase
MRLSRREKLLFNIDVGQLRGLEIGALSRPVVRRTDGQVLYADYLGTRQLREKYKDDVSVRVDDLVEVDIVTGQVDFAAAWGQTEKVDYIVASHVIEHVPDLVAWLDSLHTILKPGGSLRLAIPDRRYTFDYLRAETRLADVVAAHLVRARAPTPHSVIDFTFNAARVDAMAAWEGKVRADQLERLHRPETVLAFARDALESGGYHDVHCWAFTPLSFATLFEDLATLGLVEFACEEFFATVYGEAEFFMNLRVNSNPGEVRESWRRARQGLEAGAVSSVPTVKPPGWLSRLLKRARHRARVAMGRT